MANVLINSFNCSHNQSRNITYHGSTDKTIIPSFNIILGLVFGVICAVGILGNSLVLTVVKRKPSMRSTTNYLLANLATADILSLLGVIPVILQMYFEHPKGQTGHYLCVFLTAGNLSVVALIASVSTLTMLAFERYMALVKPMNGVRLNQDTVRYAIVSTWTVAIVFAMPFFIRTTRGDKTDDGLTICTQQWASHREKGVFLTIFFIFLFVIPYLIIIYCYGAIIKGIYFSNTICPMNVGTPDSDSRSKRRIVEVLIIVTMTFTFCVGSFAIVNTLKETGLYERHLYLVATSLLFVNASVNPIIYAFRSSNYKRAFKEILRFRLDSLETENG